MFKISNAINIENTTDEVWDLISSPGHLNLFHPFCKKNNVLESKKTVIVKDQLIYLNGLTYYRSFTEWHPGLGYRLKIGSKNAKESEVKWQIIENQDLTCIKISVKPYVSTKIPRLLYPFFHYFLIRPKLKSYLSSVLNGLRYYLVHKKEVKPNQFGEHSWFTQT